MSGKGESNALKQILALYLDVPSPQVRVDVWTVQINSQNTRPNSRERALQKMDEIRAGIQIIRDLTGASRVELAKYLQKMDSDGKISISKHAIKDAQANYPAPDALELSQKLKNVGFETEPGRPLTIAEILIFLGFQKDRTDFVEALTPSSSPQATGVSAVRGRLADRLQELLKDAKGVVSGKPEGHLNKEELEQTENMVKQGAESPAAKQALLRLLARIEAQVASARLRGRPVLPRLAAQYDRSLAGPDASALGNFLTAWIETSQVYENEVGDDQTLETAPLKLTRASAAADQWLKQAMDALTADIQDLFV